MLGVGVTRNVAEAIKCWRWAAEHGEASSQNDLGYALKTGEAGKVDLVEACMWFQLAEKGGIEKAKINLANVSSKLTDEQSKEATQRAENFHPQPMPELSPVKRNDNPGTPSLDILTIE
jgi:TPR repeat protein